MRLRFFFTLALLPSLSSAQFGTEIELVGARHRAEVACFAGSVAGVGAGAGVAAFADDKEGKGYVVMGLVAGVPALCVPYRLAAGGAQDAYLNRIEAALRAQSPEAKISIVPSGSLKQNAVEAVYPDGTRIVFSQDPGVIEIKTILNRSGEVAAKKAFFEREIYGVGRRVGLRAPKRDGLWNGGHIHIDIERAFHGDPQKLKRFVLDFWAHPELVEGLLVKDSYNAPALKLADPRVREQIRIFEEQMDSLSAAERKLNPETLWEIERQGLFGKRTALNLNEHFGTLEIRGLRSQRSADDLFRILKMLEAEIQFTNAGGGIVPALPGALKARPADSFAAYLSRAGLDYEEMKLLVPKRFRQSTGACAGFFARMMGN